MLTDQQSFEKLDVYQQARALAKAIYKVSRNFPKIEQYGLTSQIRRASISVPLNIAEGQGRRSKKDNKQFLVIARGSIFELLALYDICSDQELITKKERAYLRKKTIQVLKMVNGLISYLSQSVK